MPPRPSIFPSLRALTASLPSSAPQSRTFACSAVDQASAVAQKRRHRDPYAIAQARARKAANISRQQVLKNERTAALGDPVRGITTPFVQSFDTALPPTPAPSQSRDVHTAGQNEASSPSQPAPGPNAQHESYLNFFLSQDEVKSSVTRSELLNAPLPTAADADSDFLRPSKPSREEQHATATEALNRIASLANGSSKDRLRVNIQRCISTFGRHNTDERLPPKAAPSASIMPKTAEGQLQKMERAGPDTGSSEVQVAILTAKIRTLADFLETRGRTDKVNKRNLRVLVHKRQKLLAYLRRKERGGPRWQNLIETLGLTEGTWRGEISL
ncbi:hypothetical protein MBLNU459_g5890t2 [Dothideomycetes sp. NU459]